MAAAAWTAADADELAFNAAGDTIWRPGGTPGEILGTEVATGQPTVVQAADEQGNKPAFIAIARGEGKNFWLLTEHTLWNWQEGAATARVTAEAPEQDFDQMASGDGGKKLLLTTKRGELWSWSADDPQLREVRMRHLDGGVRCPCVLADGTFLFAIEGDLWHGWVEREKDEDDGAIRLLLWAYRMAPLAERETYPGTPSQIGVKEIAAAHGTIYVSVGRMGGSGWGHLARLKAPQPFRGEWTEHNSVNDTIAALNSAEKIMDNMGWSDLCATADGSRLRFTGEGRTVYLMEKTGPPEPMKTPTAP